jgi:hypothetical protein
MGVLAGGMTALPAGAAFADGGLLPHPRTGQTGPSTAPGPTGEHLSDRLDSTVRDVTGTTADRLGGSVGRLGGTDDATRGSTKTSESSDETSSHTHGASGTGSTTSGRARERPTGTHQLQAAGDASPDLCHVLRDAVRMLDDPPPLDPADVFAQIPAEMRSQVPEPLRSKVLGRCMTESSSGSSPSPTPSTGGNGPGHGSGRHGSGATGGDQSALAALPHTGPVGLALVPLGLVLLAGGSRLLRSAAR